MSICEHCGLVEPKLVVDRDEEGNVRRAYIDRRCPGKCLRPQSKAKPKDEDDES